MNTDKLKNSSQFDIRTINRKQVADIKEYQINKALSKSERMNHFIEHFSNQYFYRCGEVVVNIEFEQSEKSLEETLTDFLIQKK